MKLRTYHQRDEKYKKASDMLTTYFKGKQNATKLAFEFCKPKNIYFTSMTIDELSEYDIPVFQRQLQNSRLQKIADSMYMYGFDMSKPIIVTLPSRSVTDGNHRATVASVFYPRDYSLPVVVMEFNSLKEEAEYFRIMQNPPGGAPVIEDRVKADFYARSPYSVEMYKLGLIDTRSVFSKKVAFRKSLTVKYVDAETLKEFLALKNPPISVQAFSKIYHWIGLQYRRGWENRSEDYINSLVLKTGHEVILHRMNHFGRWLFSWVDEDISIKKDLFRQSVLIGFLDFYLLVIKQPGITQKQIDNILKMASDKFLRWGFWKTRLMACKPEEALDIVLDHYNYNRSSNRISKIEGFSDMFGIRAL